MFIFIIFPCKDITQISAEQKTFWPDTKPAQLIPLWNKCPEGTHHQRVGALGTKLGLIQKVDRDLNQSNMQLQKLEIFHDICFENKTCQHIKNYNFLKWNQA